MKRFFFKISSFLMALIVLFSTFTFTVAQHYCGGDLVDFSFFGKAETCGMEIQNASDSFEYSLEKKGCCEDEMLSNTGQHDLKLTIDKLSFEQLQYVFPFAYSYLNLFLEQNGNTVPFNHYPPPFLVKDINILDQTFLI
ncbi:HYC_CC_PP family protein [Maribacter arcticus]|uniref:HYC_CC_PP family protein n=1 Tax=Maribacter arcticus TaxID=561365 RepID=UPI0030DAF623|tara:strand:- start:555 stop:971 length:417 start_codon:yes stop_codon:yes gene_type:complete